MHACVYTFNFSTWQYGSPFKSKPSHTSAHACGEVTGCAPDTKRLASVAPEVNPGECTLHSPLKKKVNKAEPTLGFETQRRLHQKSKTWVPVAPKKHMCSPKTLKKKTNLELCYLIKNMLQFNKNGYMLRAMPKEIFFTIQPL